MIELKVKGPNRKFIIQSLRCELKDKNQVLDLNKYRSLSVPNNKLSKDKFFKNKNKYFKVQQRKSIQNIYTQDSKNNKKQNCTIQPRYQTQFNQYTYYRVMHKNENSQVANRQFCYQNQLKNKKQFQTIQTDKQQTPNKKPQLLLRPLADYVSLNQYIKNMMQNKKYHKLKSNLIKQNECSELESLQLNGHEISLINGHEISLVNGHEISLGKNKARNCIQNKNKTQMNDNSVEKQQLQDIRMSNSKQQFNKQMFKIFCQKRSKQSLLSISQKQTQKMKSSQNNFIKYLKSSNKWNVIRKYNFLQHSYDKEKHLSSLNQMSLSKKKVDTQNKKQFYKQICKSQNYPYIQRQKSDIHQIKPNKAPNLNLPEIQILKSTIGPWNEQLYNDSCIKKRKKTKFKN